MDVSMKDLVAVITEGHVIDIVRGSSESRLVVDGQPVPDWSVAVLAANNGNKIVALKDQFVSALIFDPKD